MIFTSAQKLPIKKSQRNYIFLAGSIDYKRLVTWRKHVINTLDSDHIFFDPTNKNHDNLGEEEMKNHIQWELDALYMADKIILYFLPDALSPISLVELGMYVDSEKLIVVCPKEFYKSRYVYTLCEKYNTPIFNDINQALIAL